MRVHSKSQEAFNVFNINKSPKNFNQIPLSPKGELNFTQDNYNPNTNKFGRISNNKTAMSLTHADMLGYMSRNLSLHNIEKEKMLQKVNSSREKYMGSPYKGLQSNNSKFFNNNSTTSAINCSSYRPSSRGNIEQGSVMSRQQGSIITRGNHQQSVFDGRVSTIEFRSQRVRTNVVKAHLEKHNNEFVEEVDCISMKNARDSFIMFNPLACDKNAPAEIFGMPIEINLDYGKKVVKLIELKDNSFNIIKVYTDDYEGKLTVFSPSADNVNFYVSKLTSDPSERENDFHSKKAAFTLKITSNNNDAKCIYIKMQAKYHCHFELIFNCEENKLSTNRSGKIRHGFMPSIQNINIKNKLSKKTPIIGAMDHGKLLKDQQDLDVFRQFMKDHKDDDPQDVSDKNESFYRNIVRQNIKNCRKQHDIRESQILNKSIEKDQRTKEAFFKMRKEFNFKKDKVLEFMKRPNVIKAERIVREAQYVKKWTQHYKRLHWQYILNIINVVKEIRAAYIHFRLRRIFETQKDRKIRLAQKFLCKAMKNRISDFYGINWADRGRLTAYRAKGSLAITATLYRKKIRRICKSQLAILFKKLGDTIVMKNYFLQFVLDIENIKRRFKNHQKKKVKCIEQIHVDWDREIFTAENWENYRNDKRKDQKLGKDPIEVYENIAFQNAQTKLSVATYVYQLESYNHVIAKFLSANNWKNKMTKLKNMPQETKIDKPLKAITEDDESIHCEDDLMSQDSDKKDKSSFMMTDPQVEANKKKTRDELDDIIYPDPHATIRYDKDYTFNSLYKKNFHDLIKKAEKIQEDFFYEKKVDNKRNQGFRSFKRQGTKVSVADGGSKKNGDLLDEMCEDEREEIELIKAMKKMSWNKSLHEVMPEDLRLSCKKKPEFWRALAYLVIKKGQSGYRFDGSE